MKVRTLVYIVIALILVNVAALATIVIQRVNQDDRPRVWEKFKDRDRGFAGNFKLSDEERAALDRAKADFEESMKPVLDSLHMVRMTLFEELKLDEPDSSIINDAIEDQGHLQTRIQKRLIKHFLANRELLRPEHRDRFLQMIEQRTRGDHFWGRSRFGGEGYRRGFKRGN